MKVGFLHSIIRPEEKLLLEAFKKKGVEVVMFDDRELALDLHSHDFKVDVMLERCINHSRALHLLKLLADKGVRTVNSYDCAEICGSKFYTTTALIKNSVETPPAMLAFTPESALQAIEIIGYPCVLKPTVGSWGRLIAKINDRDSAEAVLEHKKFLGSYHHSIFYIQKYIKKKKGSDIRSFVIGGECICAIYRTADHWKTNTATGAETSNCPVTDEIREMSLAAAKAVKGDVVAVDLFEAEDGTLAVNEVNYTMEFRNSIKVTGVDIPGKIVDYVLKVANGKS